MTTIAGVVLAAGLSERMGTQKQLLPYQDTTLLGAVVRAANGSTLDPIVVVLGAAAIEVEATLSPSRASVALNPNYHDGNLSSLRTGVDAVGPHDAVMLLLGDMPEVTAEIIDVVAKGWRSDRRTITVARYRDGVGHPFVLSADTTGRLGDLAEPKALWRLVEQASDVGEIAIDRDRPIDVDTPEDYERLVAGQ